ncbi:MAG: protein kinase, partial [Myxococcales bacterium]|nr:protein kinase [Myxococcales bacterium]
MSQLTYDPLEGSGKYKILRELGRGGMGEVFLGEHASLGSKVVVKLLHAELSDKSNLVDRMRLEAQACARLNHPNIVRVTDFDRTPSGRPYFVMEYLPGQSLADEAEAAGGVLPLAKSLDLVVQALEGLSVAHAAGLV